MVKIAADFSALKLAFGKNKTLGWLTTLFVVILALLPFHAFLTTWLSSLTGSEQLVKSWKELLLLFVAIPLGAHVVFKNPRLLKILWNRTVNRLALLYGGLHLLLAVVFRSELDATLASLAMNLRFIVFFGLAQILAELLPSQNVRRLSQTIVLVGAVVVAIFGILQVFVLPVDFLEHFGYSPDTVAPYLTIDQNPDFVRISSFLRGPNPLGAFLILPILYFGWRLFKNRSRGAAFGLVLGLPVMYFSYSRSAWLGLLVGAAVLIFLGAKSWKKLFIFGGTALVFVSLLAGASLKSSEFLRNIVVHDYSSVVSGDSTSEHWRALKAAAGDIAREPLGGGPGTAGPASFYNNERQRIGENYFLQIGQELGVLGMIIFIAINVLVAGKLLLQRSNLWPRLLLASFAGLTVVSLFLHGWADETVALTWWGLAGLYQNQKQ